jgi:hypothetical protein
MQHSIQIAVMAAVIGYTYAAVLIQPGEALRWLWEIFYRMFTKKIELPASELPEELRDMNIQQEPKYIIKEHWILKPLGGCAKCVSGQIALWTYIISFIQSYHLYKHCIFTIIIDLIFTVCLSILLTKAIQKLL